MAQPLKISLPSSARCAALCRRSSCPPCRGSLQPTEASPSPSTSRSPPPPPPPFPPLLARAFVYNLEINSNGKTPSPPLSPSLRRSPLLMPLPYSSLGPPPILSWTVVAASIGSRSAKLPVCSLPRSHSRPSSSTLITPGRLTHSRKFVE